LQENHKVRKEAKGEIDYLNSILPNETKQLFEEQATSTVNKTLTNFIILGKPLISPLIFPFTIQPLISDDFFH